MTTEAVPAFVFASRTNRSSAKICCFCQRALAASRFWSLNRIFSVGDAVEHVFARRTMPKWYKPQLNEVGSVWLEPSAEMAANYPRQGKRSWKIALLFAHGRPEDLTASSQNRFHRHRHFPRRNRPQPRRSHVALPAPGGVNPTEPLVADRLSPSQSQPLRPGSPRRLNDVLQIGIFWFEPEETLRP